MSYTRFYDDPARISKRLQISTNAGRYALMRPGPGISVPYIADPHYRLEKWAANTMTNAVNIEADLFGLTRRLTRDDINENDYKKRAAHANTFAIDTKTVDNRTLVDESRAIVPAFQFREAEMYRWEFPFLDPQKNLEIMFNHNIQSRIIEKDTWNISNST